MHSNKNLKNVPRPSTVAMVLNKVHFSPLYCEHLIRAVALRLVYILKSGFSHYIYLYCKVIARTGLYTTEALTLRIATVLIKKRNVHVIITGSPRSIRVSHCEMWIVKWSVDFSVLCWLVHHFSHFIVELKIRYRVSLFIYFNLVHPILDPCSSKNVRRKSKNCDYSN